MCIGQLVEVGFADGKSDPTSQHLQRQCLTLPATKKKHNSFCRCKMLVKDYPSIRSVLSIRLEKPTATFRKNIGVVKAELLGELRGEMSL